MSLKVVLAAQGIMKESQPLWGLAVGCRVACNFLGRVGNAYFYDATPKSPEGLKLYAYGRHEWFFVFPSLSSGLRTHRVS